MKTLSVDSYGHCGKWRGKKQGTKEYTYTHTHSMCIARYRFCKKRKWQEYVFVFIMSVERNVGGDLSAESGDLTGVRADGVQRERG